MSACQCFTPRDTAPPASLQPRLRLFNRITAVLLVGWVVIVGLAAEYAAPAASADAILLQIVR